MFASVSASLNRKKRIDAVRRVGNSPFGGVTVSLPGRSCLHRKSTGSRVYVAILFLFFSFFLGVSFSRYLPLRRHGYTLGNE